jgi:Glycosyltransferase family 87
MARKPIPALHRLFVSIAERRETAILACTLALFQLARILIGRRGAFDKRDFSYYYVWGAALRRHIDPYTANLDPLARELGVFIKAGAKANYPPTFVLLWEPLAFLGPVTAYWLWIALTLAFLAGTLMLLFGRRGGLPSTIALELAALAILYEPLKIHFYFAQTQILILFLIIVALAQLERGRDGSAGMILALAGLLKAYPLVLGAYLILTRKWRSATFMTLGLLVGFAVTLAIVGLPGLGFFSHSSLSMNLQLAAAGRRLLPTVSLSGTLERIFLYIHLNGVHDLARQVLTTGAYISVLALTALATLSSATDQRRNKQAFGLWVTAMVLLTPGAWIHYMVLLLAPLALLAEAAAAGKASKAAVLCGVASYTLTQVSWAILGSRLQLPLWLENTLTESAFISVVLVFVAGFLLCFQRIECLECGNHRVTNLCAGWQHNCDLLASQRQ